MSQICLTWPFFIACRTRRSRPAACSSSVGIPETHVCGSKKTTLMASVDVYCCGLQLEHVAAGCRQTSRAQTPDDYYYRCAPWSRITDTRTQFHANRGRTTNDLHSDHSLYTLLKKTLHSLKSYLLSFMWLLLYNNTSDFSVVCHFSFV